MYVHVSSLYTGDLYHPRAAICWQGARTNAAILWIIYSVQSSNVTVRLVLVSSGHGRDAIVACALHYECYTVYASRMEDEPCSVRGMFFCLCMCTCMHTATCIMLPTLSVKFATLR